MHLSWYNDVLSTRTPFCIANQVISTKDVIVVCLEHEGIIGYGEAAASTFYQQTAVAITNTIATIADDLAYTTDPFDVLSMLDQLAERYPYHPSIRAALDAATHDWIGKRLEQPVYRLLGVDARALQPTAISIGITKPSEAAATTQRLITSGCQIIKLKVGLSTLKEDYALVAAVRDSAPKATLYLDANGGWPATEAHERILALYDFRPALIEQPIAPGQIDKLTQITAQSPVPIIADEDVLGLADVLRVMHAVTGINIKLTKCGGLRQALAMSQLARASGLRVMLGCMIASTLGLAPAVHLAPLADYIDLDGHLFLTADPWCGIGGDGGLLKRTVQPGLGVYRRHP